MVLRVAFWVDGSVGLKCGKYGVKKVLVKILLLGRLMMVVILEEVVVTVIVLVVVRFGDGGSEDVTQAIVFSCW